MLIVNNKNEIIIYNVNKVYNKQNNQLVIFDMKNISLGCCALVFSTPNNASSWDIFQIKNSQLIILYILHRFRNKFLQPILISLGSPALELYQNLGQMRGPIVPNFEHAPGNRNQDLMIARLTLYLTTMDNTRPHFKDYTNPKVCHMTKS